MMVLRTWFAITYTNSSTIVDDMYEAFPRPAFPWSEKCLARNGSNWAINSIQPKKFPLWLDPRTSLSPRSASPLSVNNFTPATTLCRTSHQYCFCLFHCSSSSESILLSTLLRSHTLMMHFRCSLLSACKQIFSSAFFQSLNPSLCENVYLHYS